MNRQVRRKNKRIEEWFKSLSQEKYDLIEKVVDVRVREVVNATNKVIDTSFSAALADVYEDITIKEREYILDLAYDYILEAESFLRKYKEGWMDELKKHEKEIKGRIEELLKAKTVKSKGIKILKREFEEVPAKDLSNLWMEVKEELNIKVPVYSLDTDIKKKEVKETEKIKIEEPEVVIEKEVVKEEKVKSNLKLVRATIQGEYGTYEKEGNSVKVGSMVFKNENELEKYKKTELAQFEEEVKKEIEELVKRKNEEKEKFMKQLGEILDVISMVV